MVKVRVPFDKRGRLTLPKEFKDHLQLDEEDDIWIEKTKDGKLVIGRVKVQREIVD